MKAFIFPLLLKIRFFYLPCCFLFCCLSIQCCDEPEKKTENFIKFTFDSEPISFVQQHAVNNQCQAGVQESETTIQFKQESFHFINAVVVKSQQGNPAFTCSINPLEDELRFHFRYRRSYSDTHYIDYYFLESNGELEIEKKEIVGEQVQLSGTFKGTMVASKPVSKLNPIETEPVAFDTVVVNMGSFAITIDKN